MNFPLFRRTNDSLSTVYIANLLLSFHYFLVLYINSSFLNLYVTEKTVGTLYTLGSIGNLILLLLAPYLLNIIGNYRLILGFMVLEGIAIAGLSFASLPILVIAFFLIHIAVIGMIAFCLDIFVEKYSVNENDTGGIRGVYLTLSNATLVIAPAVVAFLLPRGDFGTVYLFSFLFLIPVFSLIRKKLRGFSVPPQTVSFSKQVERYRKDINLRNIFIVNLVLQIFYAWMVIYVPIYLSSYVGFSWDKIGILFAFMVLPFILFELPLGKIADLFLGEKEILVGGLAIMAASTALISYISTPSFILWAVILFLTRVGASAVEIMTESYFFKHVNAVDYDAISAFRMTRPISYIVAPLIAGMALASLPYRFIFLVLVGIILLAIEPALRLKDTR